LILFAAKNAAKRNTLNSLRISLSRIPIAPSLRRWWRV